MVMRLPPKILLLALLTAVTYGQTVTGIVQGRVVDPVGRVMPGVVVRAKEAATGTIRTTLTNSDGFYEFSYLALGDYDVTVEAPRLNSQTGRASVELNRTTVLNFEFALAGVQE